jgi:hypothetical protein
MRMVHPCRIPRRSSWPQLPWRLEAIGLRQPLYVGVVRQELPLRAPSVPVSDSSDDTGDGALMRELLLGMVPKVA